MNYPKVLILAAIIFAIPLICGCSTGSSTVAPEVVETYLNALVNRDLNRMISVSCASWEPQAKVEYDSFSAVKLTIENLKCEKTQEDKGATLVTCNGAIIANYGAEDLVIDIANRTFKVANEGGEDRMCGYAEK